MNRFKFQALLQEFPFLEEILRGKKNLDVNSISIKRCDEKLLNSTPDEYYWDGSAGESYQWDRVSFVLQKNGEVEVLYNYVKSSGTSGSNYAHSQTRHWEGETIIEALDTLENPDDIQYIVWEEREYHDWNTQELIDSYEITIYKVPKNETLSDILERARKKAMTKVMAESNF